MKEINTRLNYSIRYASIQELQMVYYTDLEAAGTYRHFDHFHRLKWTYHKQRNIFTWFLFQGNGQLEEVGWAYLGPSIMAQCKKYDQFPLTEILNIAYSPYVQYQVLLPHTAHTSQANNNAPVTTSTQPADTTTVCNHHNTNQAATNTGILPQWNNEQPVHYALEDIHLQPEMTEEEAKLLLPSKTGKQYRSAANKPLSTISRYRLFTKNKEHRKKTAVRNTS